MMVLENKSDRYSGGILCIIFLLSASSSSSSTQNNDVGYDAWYLLSRTVQKPIQIENEKPKNIGRFNRKPTDWTISLIFVLIMLPSTRAKNNDDKFFNEGNLFRATHLLSIHIIHRIPHICVCRVDRQRQKKKKKKTWFISHQLKWTGHSPQKMAFVRSAHMNWSFCIYQRKVFKMQKKNKQFKLNVTKIGMQIIMNHSTEKFSSGTQLLLCAVGSSDSDNNIVGNLWPCN